VTHRSAEGGAQFDYTQSPNVTAAKMRDLAEGGYIERAEPVLFIGECEASPFLGFSDAVR
jgi:hypothetical protein